MKTLTILLSALTFYLFEVIVSGFFVYILWNWLATQLFVDYTITYTQSIVLFVLWTILAKQTCRPIKSE